MKQLKILVVISALLLCGVEPADAVIKKVAQTGYQFLKIDMAARPAAMGGAYTMVGQNASALFYNPAGMARMQSSLDFFANRTSWIADINYNAGAIAKNLGNVGVVGLSFVSADYGQITGYRVDPTANKGFQSTGNIDVSAYAVGVGYSRALTNKFSVGGQIKYTRQYLGETVLNQEGKTVKNQTGGLAYDFGTVYYPGWKSFRMGMSIRNFSKEFQYAETPFDLPLTFRIGFAMDMLDLVGSHPNNNLVLSVDALHPRDWTERVQFGAEYNYADLLFLRAGYKANYSSEGLSLGFGVHYDLAGINLKVDYSYSQAGVFNGVSRLTLGGSF